MASSITPLNTPERLGELRFLPLAAAAIVFAGNLGAMDTNGRLVPAADTAGLRTVGRIEGSVDNTAGGAGALSANVKRGVFKFANSVANAITAAMVGKTAFVEDDHTVASTTANKIAAGLIVEVEADGVWIDTCRDAIIPTLALTSVQNATTAASDLATAQALANALKANYNALQADVAALITALNT